MAVGSRPRAGPPPRVVAERRVRQRREHDRHRALARRLLVHSPARLAGGRPPPLRSDLGRGRASCRRGVRRRRSSSRGLRESAPDRSRARSRAKESLFPRGESARCHRRSAGAGAGGPRLGPPSALDRPHHRRCAPRRHAGSAPLALGTRGKRTTVRERSLSRLSHASVGLADSHGPRPDAHRPAAAPTIDAHSGAPRGDLLTGKPLYRKHRGGGGLPLPVSREQRLPALRPRLFPLLELGPHGYGNSRHDPEASRPPFTVRRRKDSARLLRLHPSRALGDPAPPLRGASLRRASRSRRVPVPVPGPRPPRGRSDRGARARPSRPWPRGASAPCGDRGSR